MKQPTMNEPPKREKSIESKLIEACVAAGLDCWKLTSPGRRGVPDRIIVGTGGLIVFVECKRMSGGLISPLQAQTMNRLRELGHQCYIVQTEDDIAGLMGFIAKELEWLKENRNAIHP